MVYKLETTQPQLSFELNTRVYNCQYSYNFFSFLVLFDLISRQKMIHRTQNIPLLLI